MMKGHLFRMLSPKDLTQILHMVGATSSKPEDIEKPTGDAAVGMLQHVTEFAYDLEVQQLKQTIKPQVAQAHHAEIYDEVMDVVTIFKLSQQLAHINGLDDFSWKDIWDPQPKRFRAILSGLINFCRYKDQQTVVIQQLKNEFQQLDSTRLGVAADADQLAQEVVAARAKNTEELPQMYAAETAALEARNSLERVQKQKQTFDRVVAEADGRLKACKDKAADNQVRISQLCEEQAQLNGQVAESPEGLQQEIQELKSSHRQRKAFVDDKGDEKRQRSMRDQVMTEVQKHIEALAVTLDKITTTTSRVEAAREKTKVAREGLSDLRRKSETQKADRVELEEQVRALQADIERASQVHAEKELELDARRQRALQKHQELMAKRTDEERAYHELQGERLKLEGELKQERRKFQAQRAELHRQRKTIQDDREAYAQGIDKLLQTSHGAEVLGSYSSQDAVAASPPAPHTFRSPGKHLRSPARSPGRALAGFRSPLGGPRIGRQPLMSPEL